MALAIVRTLQASQITCIVSALPSTPAYLMIRTIRITGSDAIPTIEVERVREVWIHGCTAARGTGVFLGEVGEENEVLLEGNRLQHAREERAAVEPENAWNTCSHAYVGTRWIRDTGERNAWLPMSAAVIDFVRARWTPEQVDGIWSVSRVAPNSREGAELEPLMDANGRKRGSALHNVEQQDLRDIYIVESRYVDERLVVFEDGDSLEISAGENGVRFLLVSGKPIGEPVAWHGPIVMNTQEELRIAFDEYQQGTFLKQSSL